MMLTRSPLTAGVRTAALAAALAISMVSLTITGCSKPEPIDGFWGYAWGVARDSVVADTAGIRLRLSGPEYRCEVTPQQMVFHDVQYGMGYDRVTLDFTDDGRLWHGRVRVAVADAQDIDSINDALHDRYGRATSDRRIERPEGRISYWYTPDWHDRDFFAPDLALAADPNEITSLDIFYGGCLIECPLYSIRITRTGWAYLWSIRGRDEVGGFAGRYDASRFPEWAQATTDPAFLALDKRYEYRGSGLTKRGTRIRSGNRERLHETVEQSGPPLLESFIDTLEVVTQSIEWDPVFAWDTLGITAPRDLDLDSLERWVAGRL